MYPWGNDRPYRAWSDMSRKQFGSRLQKLAVHAGFGCPNRDGTKGVGGCTFCNNEGFIPAYCDPQTPLHQQIDRGLAFVRKRYPRARIFVAYFQAYSNTYGPLELLKEVYSHALDHPAISGLVVGTRPDCVDEEKLDYLAFLAKTHYVKIEYGVESCDDETLARVNRGHRFEDSKRALEMTASRGLPSGIHLIFGLPGESRSHMMAQADQVNALPISTIKFHQLQIVDGTPMAAEYLSYPERFELFGLDDYIAFVAEFLERLRPDIAIERLSGEIPPRLIAGKRWEGIRADGVMRRIEAYMKKHGMQQGRLYKSTLQ